MLGLDGRRAGFELGSAGQSPPERDDLLGRGLPAPRSEQELLGEGPQVHRVRLAPGQRVAGQCQRGARRQQGVGLHEGHSGAGHVERPELLPAHGRLQELRRDAAQRVAGPGEVVGPHRDDHRRLVGVRAAGGPADDLGVGDHAVGRLVTLVQRLRGRLPQGLLRPFLGRRLVGRHDDPRVLVAEGLVEYGGTLAVPGLARLVFLARRRDVRHAGLVTGTVVPSIPLEHGHHQESEAGGPGEQEDQRHDVDHVAGRVCTVVDAGAGLGPIRRQSQLGRPEQEDGRERHTDDHENGERIPQGLGAQAPQGRAPNEGLARASDPLTPPGGRLDTNGDCIRKTAHTTLDMSDFLIYCSDFS